MPDNFSTSICRDLQARGFVSTCVWQVDLESVHAKERAPSNGVLQVGDDLTCRGRDWCTDVIRGNSNSCHCGQRMTTCTNAS